MKIKELESNQLCTIPLAVISATSRETRAGKPYLALELFDGTESILGNFWDWGGKSIPQNNTILDVTAQVTEWQGNKQLNVKSMTTNTEMNIADFMPSSGHDISAVYDMAVAMAENVEDTMLRALTLGVLELLESFWKTVPGAKTIHHAYTAGTLIHSISVAKIALAIARTVDGANEDLCFVGGMLHDLGKLHTYKTTGITIDITDEGILYDHLFMGAETLGALAERYVDADDENGQAKIQILKHILLSHHGKLEHGAVVTPACIEAHIVHHADALDAAAEQIRYQSSKVDDAKWTNRIWALDNKPHLTTQYVNEVVSQR